MKQLLFSPAARRDLEGIFDYSLKNWGLAQAETYISDLWITCREIADDLKTGQNADPVRQGYRRQVCGSHIIFYKATDNRIEIIRILHKRMNVSSHV